MAGGVAPVSHLQFYSLFSGKELWSKESTEYFLFHLCESFFLPIWSLILFLLFWQHIYVFWVHSFLASSHMQIWRIAATQFHTENLKNITHKWQFLVEMKARDGHLHYPWVIYVGLVTAEPWVTIIIWTRISCPKHLETIFVTANCAITSDTRFVKNRRWEKLQDYSPFHLAWRDGRFTWLRSLTAYK